MNSGDDRLNDLFRHRDRLVRDLERFGRSRQDAQDLAQEALMYTWTRIDNVKPGAEWVYVRTAARHRAINQATRNPVEVSFDEAHCPEADEEPTVEQRLIARQERARFREQFDAAQNELPQETRLCVVLRRRGSSYKQIASLLRTSVAAVQSRLHRAIEHFRERVGVPPEGIHWLELAGENDHDHER
jgi:RNA polymerase sigma factor (sigma-70 family)